MESTIDVDRRHGAAVCCVSKASLDFCQGPSEKVVAARRNDGVDLKGS